ncbi:unnamed protein product, partial [Vitis vinifera]
MGICRPLHLEDESRVTRKKRKSEKAVPGGS